MRRDAEALALRMGVPDLLLPIVLVSRTGAEDAQPCGFVPDRGASSCAAKLLLLCVRRFQFCWVTMKGESYCRVERKVCDIACSSAASLPKQESAQPPDIDLAVAGGPGVLG